jgi:hypothetical protein
MSRLHIFAASLADIARQFRVVEVPWFDLPSALPAEPSPTLDGVFAALEWRRLRLRQGQQVPEWTAAHVARSGTALASES